MASFTEVLDHLGIAEIAATALSFGTDIPIDLATAGRARAVVLIDQAPDFRCATYPPGLVAVSRPSLIALAQRAPAFAVRLGSRQGFAPGFRYASVPGFADVVVRDFRGFAPPMGRIALVDRARELAADPLDERIQRLDVPVLAIHGREDRMYACAPSIARYCAAGARTAIIENAGHSPHVETPRAVAAVLRDFLA
ncbi:alpha/beta hydrolase [Nocardia sp. NPDC060249]|uniref:alpha/beta hydrolase n=1 Tax=Nocardia sp. NPDC060249 TaxID=3347082 RepID=UPI0036558327